MRKQPNGNRWPEIGKKTVGVIKSEAVIVGVTSTGRHLNASLASRVDRFQVHKVHKWLHS